MRDPMSLYPVENPYPQARGMMGQAANSYGAMGQNRTTTTEAPGKTVGGGISAAAGGLAAGAAVGSMMAAPGAVGLAAVGGPVTLGIGAAVMGLAYLLS